MRSIILYALVVILLSACGGNDYNAMVERELARNVRYDSLFLGLKFGMTRKEFYGHCWELNKQGLLRQGPGNFSAQYELEDALKYPAHLNFYPEFIDDQINIMPTEFWYRDFAPWNKAMVADSLLIDVKDLMEEWYGGKFIKLEDDLSRKVWVKVDGNRRIRIFKKNLNTVRVDFHDLTNMKEEESATDQSNG